MTMEKIADKIQKLFALAGNNPDEKEAQAALMKAQELIAKYNIEESELMQEGESFIHDLIETKVTSNHYNNILASYIASGFGCKIIRRKQKTQYKLSIFGRKESAEAAASALEFAYKVMNKKANQIVKEHDVDVVMYGKTYIYNTFASGFCWGIRDSVGEQTKALAIVVPQDTKEAFEKKFPDTRYVQQRGAKIIRNEHIKQAGYSAGKNAMAQRSLN